MRFAIRTTINDDVDPIPSDTNAAAKGRQGAPRASPGNSFLFPYPSHSVSPGEKRVNAVLRVGFAIEVPRAPDFREIAIHLCQEPDVL